MQIPRKNREKSSQTAEAGFTLIEMLIVIVIASILGTFIFQVLTKSLAAQITTQKRKERSDDAIQSLERMNREFREANTLYFAVTNYLIFQKNVTSSADTNTFIKYVLDTTTDTLTRHSAATYTDVLTSTTGDTIATNVSTFYCSNNTDQKTLIELEFVDGSDWKTNVFRRNYELPPP